MNASAAADGGNTGMLQKTDKPSKVKPYESESTATPRITNVQILLFNAVLTLNYSFQVAEHPTRWQIMFE